MMVGINNNTDPSISYMHLLQFRYVLDVDSFFISVVGQILSVLYAGLSLGF
jgi:hypothetical protein